jgi:hypothetical protein
MLAVAAVVVVCCVCCRWDVVSPENSPNQCWEMVLSTTQAIPADAPLLLTYFSGSNDEFLLHYGK